MKGLMKKSIVIMAMAALMSGFGVNVVRGQAAVTREQLDDRTHEVNDTAKRAGMDVTLRRISTETGVPLEQVQAMHKKYSDTGGGGLLVACVMANETKKTPEEFLKRHASGKSWTAIARDNNVSLDRLNERLNRLDNAIGAADRKENKQNEKAKAK
jgi:hypothetical protein